MRRLVVLAVAVAMAGVLSVAIYLVTNEATHLMLKVAGGHTTTTLPPTTTSTTTTVPPPPPATVPNVTNGPASVATMELRAAGLYSEPVTGGTCATDQVQPTVVWVGAQTPPPGTVASQGGIVKLYVCAPPVARPTVGQEFTSLLHTTP